MPVSSLIHCLNFQNVHLKKMKAASKYRQDYWTEMSSWSARTVFLKLKSFPIHLCEGGVQLALFHLKVVKKEHITIWYVSNIYDNWMLKYNQDGQTGEKSTSMKQGMKVALATITRKSHNLSGSSSRPALWQNNAYSNLKPKFYSVFGVLLYCEVGKPEVSQRSWLGNRAMQSQQRQDLNTTSSSQQNLFVFINIYEIKDGGVWF